jgi:hypothetical protein
MFSGIKGRSNQNVLSIGLQGIPMHCLSSLHPFLMGFMSVAPKSPYQELLPSENSRGTQTQNTVFRNTQ